MHAGCWSHNVRLSPIFAAVVQSTRSMQPPPPLTPVTSPVSLHPEEAFESPCLSTWTCRQRPVYALTI